MPHSSSVAVGLEVLPTAHIPVGGPSDFVPPSAGVAIGIEAIAQALPWLSGGVSLAYAPAGLANDGVLHTLIGGATAHATLPVPPHFEIAACAAGGYAHTRLELPGRSLSGGGSYVEGRGAVRWVAARAMALGVYAGYRHLFGVMGTVLAGATMRFVLE